MAADVKSCMLMQMIDSHLDQGQTAPSPQPRREQKCSDCAIPTVFRASIPDLGADRRIRVSQCPNCAKLVWE
jgi:hypothetical protein